MRSRECAGSDAEAEVSWSKHKSCFWCLPPLEAGKEVILWDYKKRKETARRQSPFQY